MGHEVSGVIVEVGEKAVKKGLKVGDRVAATSLNSAVSAITARTDSSSFASMLTSQTTRLQRVPCLARIPGLQAPRYISLKKGCLLEPVSIAVRAMDKAELKLGQRVAVSGAAL
jgi:(R,R)-butanediol dehydrogenase/meso-butanediol dehydrogenase/diacetyl reductase/L-iditol 2-dehydrogenase